MNAAHKFDDGRFGKFMNAYLYEEWEGGKGSNQVVSLIMQSLRDEGILREDENGRPITGGSLSIFCDNCSGQNKNNNVLKMATFLVECGYFKSVEIVFLIVGHTKNACDRLFNSMKKGYRQKNIWSFSELLPILNESEDVKVHAVTNNQHFRDWQVHFDKYYKHLTGILKSHIFVVEEGGISTKTVKGEDIKSVTMTMKECDLPDAFSKTVQLKKKGELNNKLPIDEVPPQHAETERNAMKVVHFDSKWRPLIPQQHHQEMCPAPTEEQKKAAKSGKKATSKETKDEKKRKMDTFEEEAKCDKKQKVAHQEDWGDNADCGFDLEVFDDEIEEVIFKELAKSMELQLDDIKMIK